VPRVEDITFRREDVDPHSRAVIANGDPPVGQRGNGARPLILAGSLSRATDVMQVTSLLIVDTDRGYLSVYHVDASVRRPHRNDSPKHVGRLATIHADAELFD
jgi:hypothetical protein